MNWGHLCPIKGDLLLSSCGKTGTIRPSDGRERDGHDKVDCHATCSKFGPGLWPPVEV